MRRAAILLLFIPCFACHDEKPKADTSHAASAEPIPSDLVYNAFVDPNKKDEAPPVAVADGGGAAPSAETSASTVKLDSAGADPKAPLRYVFSTKTRAVDATVNISGGGQGLPDQPPLHFVFTATPKPKNMLGHDATLDVSITKFDITLPPNMPPQQAAGKDQLEKALVGLKGHFDVTTFGDVGDASFDSDQVPRGAGDIVSLVQQTFELLVVPVPAEPVGVGAKWEKSDTKQLADQGASVSLKTTITLTARDAQTATFKVENAASGTMTVNDPRAPKGTSIDRKSTATFDVVARLDGVAQKVDGSSTTDVTQKVPGQPDRAVTLKMTEKLTSK